MGDDPIGPCELAFGWFIERPEVWMGGLEDSRISFNKHISSICCGLCYKSDTTRAT
jgi:hypothetical protein